MDKNKNYLGTADKIVIALGFVFFLTASGLVINEHNKLNERLAKQEQLNKAKQKAQQAKTIQFSKKR
ncbi:MAG: hypothetical protein J6R99_04750 [Alphaproteobacteria bacterium]|nr:hypothetical protein [Alphaproteobacteria bacterium]